VTYPSISDQASQGAPTLSVAREGARDSDDPCARPAGPGRRAGARPDHRGDPADVGRRRPRRGVTRLVVTDASTITSGALPLAVLVAVAAGLVSFASPCVLPLVPGFLGYVTGLSDVALAQRRTSRMVLGACPVRARVHRRLHSRGGGVSAAGAALATRQGLLTRIGGAVVIVFALVFLGVGGRLGSQREVRTHWRPGRWLAGAPLLGAGLRPSGWSPCTGPTLGAIMPLPPRSAGDAPVARGVALGDGIQRGVGVALHPGGRRVVSGPPEPAPGCAAISAGCSSHRRCGCCCSWGCSWSADSGRASCRGCRPTSSPASRCSYEHREADEAIRQPRSARSAGRAGRGATSPRCARRCSCCCCCRSRRCQARSSRSAPSTRGGSPTTSRTTRPGHGWTGWGFFNVYTVAVVLGGLSAAGRLAHRLHRARAPSCTGMRCARSPPRAPRTWSGSAACASFSYAVPPTTRSPQRGRRCGAALSVSSPTTTPRSAPSRAICGRPATCSSTWPCAWSSSASRSGTCRAGAAMSSSPRGRPSRRSSRSYRHLLWRGSWSTRMTVAAVLDADRQASTCGSSAGRRGAVRRAARVHGIHNDDGAPRGRDSRAGVNRQRAGDPRGSRCLPAGQRLCARGDRAGRRGDRALSAGDAVPRAGQLLYLGRRDQGACGIAEDARLLGVFPADGGPELRQRAGVGVPRPEKPRAGVVGVGRQPLPRRALAVGLLAQHERAHRRAEGRRVKPLLIRLASPARPTNCPAVAGRSLSTRSAGSPGSRCGPIQARG
jgi:cytochrome c-type biogenesis protein